MLFTLSILISFILLVGGCGFYIESSTWYLAIYFASIVVILSWERR
jgi:hypothetical protein